MATELTESQKSALKSWIESGESLAEAQRRLRDEFGVTMTYMDLRFLVDDLGAEFADKEPESEDIAGEADAADAVESAAAGEAERGGKAGAETSAEDPELVDDGGGGQVKVDVDAIMRPGAVVSGNVTFSDGKTLGWQLTSSGQLGLIPGDDPEYRPSPEDVQAFQEQLERVLREKGY
ncbi:MAG: hypothetical protein ACLFUF_03685 [Opitutales bacterium]